MNTSAKGRRNEERSMEFLEGQGYDCTLLGGRHAASQGLVDIAGFRRDGVVLAQVRTRDWPGRQERAELAEAKAQFAAPNVRLEMHRWRPRARQPDVVEI